MKVNKMQLFLAGTIAVSSISVATPAAAAEYDFAFFDNVLDKEHAKLVIARDQVDADLTKLIVTKDEKYKTLVEDVRGLISTIPDSSQEAKEMAIAFEKENQYLSPPEQAAIRTFLADIAEIVVKSDLTGSMATAMEMKAAYDKLPSNLKAIVDEDQMWITALSIKNQIEDLVDEDDGDNGGGGNGGGGGGTTTPSPETPGIPETPETPAPPNTVVTTPADMAKNPSAVIDMINKEADMKEFRIDAPVSGTTAIPFGIVQAVNTKNSAAVISVGTKESGYVLPVSVIDGGALAKKLGANVADLSITLSMAKQESKGTLLPFAIDFELKATAPGNKTIDITYLGYPVLRTIETPVAYNAASTVGVRLNEDGTMTPVPTYIDGTNAGLYFSSNSAYTLIENSKTFKDIDNRGYWAEETIEKLASRMVFSGKTADSFSPTAAITRGEFAAVLARGLGLVAEDKNGAGFTDVSLNQAINRNGEIAAVVEAGIVNGYGNGQFLPANAITRDEAAIMISNAMDYIGKEIKMDGTKRVASFNDYRYISASARPHVERVLQAGYISGFKDNTYRSENNTTRAETSVILYNFLKSIKFIN